MGRISPETKRLESEVKPNIFEKKVPMLASRSIEKKYYKSEEALNKMIKNDFGMEDSSIGDVPPLEALFDEAGRQHSEVLNKILNNPDSSTCETLSIIRHIRKIAEKMKVVGAHQEGTYQQMETELNVKQIKILELRRQLEDTRNPDGTFTDAALELKKERMAVLKACRDNLNKWAEHSEALEDEEKTDEYKTDVKDIESNIHSIESDLTHGK